MVHSFLSKAALLLVLILLLATPAAQAAEPGTRRSPIPSMLPALPDVFAQAWDYLTRVWATDAESDNGCGLAPGGRCHPGQTVKAEADNGCGIDPSGGCGQ
jgi:hypothetical protein